MDTLIRVNPAKEDEVLTARGLQRVQREVDPVIDGRQVIQPRGAIGVADGDKVSVTILLIDGHDSGLRESMNRREDRRLHQAREGERHEVVMTVNEGELAGSVLERF